MPVRAPVVPETIVWAREVAGLDTQDIAKVAGTSTAQVVAWESGEFGPTMRQLGLLSKRLGRTMASFFLPPPERTGIPETVDFRGRRADGVSPDLRAELKQVEQYREYYQTLRGKETSDAVIGAVTWENLELRANDLRARLGVEPGDGRDFKEWVSLLERAGVLVFQSTGIHFKEYRGVSIFHETNPVILLNGADSQNGRTFSLFHEIAHLANRSSAICLNRENDAQEVICNRFSAEFLMPKRMVEGTIHSAPRDEWVFRVARRFKVSDLAAVIQLERLSLMTQADIDAVWEATDEAVELERKRLKERKGSPPHWRLRKRDLGDKYIVAVIAALEDERIDLVDATYMLNTRAQWIDSMHDELLREGAL